VDRGVDASRLPGRLAAAPISWGVCEVPGWGRQLPPERVPAEMADLGITATELGPQGRRKGDITRDELVRQMSGGAELEALEHELGRQLDSSAAG